MLAIDRTLVFTFVLRISDSDAGANNPRQVLQQFFLKRKIVLTLERFVLLAEMYRPLDTIQHRVFMQALSRDFVRAQGAPKTDPWRTSCARVTGYRAFSGVLGCTVFLTCSRG